MTTTVQLRKPILGHAGPISQVVLREPTAREYWRMGDPQIAARNADGSLFVVENHEAIQAYIDACVTEPPALLLEQLSLADGIAVKSAVLDFFAGARSETSPTGPGSSSST